MPPEVFNGIVQIPKNTSGGECHGARSWCASGSGGGDEPEGAGLRRRDRPVPGLRSLTGRALRTQIDDYLDRIIDRDVPDAGREVRRPASLRAWLTAYAAATAEAVSYEKARDAATYGHVRRHVR